MPEYWSYTIIVIEELGLVETGFITLMMLNMIEVFSAKYPVLNPPDILKVKLFIEYVQLLSPKIGTNPETFKRENSFGNVIRIEEYWGIGLLQVNLK